MDGIRSECDSPEMTLELNKEILVGKPLFWLNTRSIFRECITDGAFSLGDFEYDILQVMSRIFIEQFMMNFRL